MRRNSCICCERIADGADLVIGSRYVPGGETVNWPASREYLAPRRIYISVALGAGLSDMTAGYRAFRRELWNPLTSMSFLMPACFQVDSFPRCQDGFDVRSANYLH